MELMMIRLNKSIKFSENVIFSINLHPLEINSKLYEATVPIFISLMRGH